MNCLHRRIKHSLAFSLVELLVVIAIIAIILAVSIPALAGAKTSATQLKSLMNLRSIGQTFTFYHDSYNAYPYAKFGFARPGESNPVAIGFNIWLIDQYWPLTMHEIAPWAENAEIWFSPGADQQLIQDLIDGKIKASTGILPSYRYSRSFVGDPTIWSPNPAGAVDRATRMHEVTFPSSKVLMLDQDQFYLRDDLRLDSPRPILMADGSASAKKDTVAVQPVKNPLYEDPPTIYHDTPMGVRGRDVSGSNSSP